MQGEFGRNLETSSDSVNKAIGYIDVYMTYITNLPSLKTDHGND